MVGKSLVSVESKSWLYHPAFPKHWERCQLYSLARWVNGLAFRDIQFSESGKPVIKIAEIKGGISSQTKFTTQNFDESVHVRPGDLLFSWSGQPETSIDVFWWRGPDGWLNQHTFRVTPGDGIDAIFFFYLLRYLKPNFIGIARNKQTTGLGHVTKRDLENIEAAVPRLPEQRTIAHILGTLDDKIELNRRMSETLEGMARALFKSWFVDFDPVRAKMDGRWKKGQSLPGLPANLYDHFPSRLNNSELGQIPEGWEVGTFANIVELIRDQVEPNDSPSTKFLHFSLPSFDDGQYPKQEFGETIKSLKFRVPPGAVLLSKLNPEVERVWLVDVSPSDQAICSTEFLVFRPRPPAGRALVYCLTRSSNFRQTLEGLVTGTSKSHQRAQVTSVLGLHIVLASEKVTREFEQRAYPKLAGSNKYRRESRTLSALRDALLPKLISGELRIKDVERFLKEAGL